MYTELARVDKEAARVIYQRNKAFYHSVIRNFAAGLGL
jgi:hypothetical protein